MRASLLVSEVASFFICWTIIATVLRIAYNFYLHPLSRFPGPSGAACTRLWLAYMEVWRGVNLTDLRFQLHEKYGTWPTVHMNKRRVLTRSGMEGDIIRIAPNEVRMPVTLAEVQNLIVMSQASLLEPICL